MHAAIDRVMQAFAMMVNLTPKEAQATRERLTQYLAGMDVDEKALAVEGLRYLRGPGVLRGEESYNVTNLRSR